MKNRKTVLTAISWGLGLGLLVNCPGFLVDIYRDYSRAATFKKVEIGMPYDKAKSILRAGGISCGITSTSDSRECSFEDFTMKYLIRVDPQRDIVVQKSCGYRRLRDY